MRQRRQWPSLTIALVLLLALLGDAPPSAAADWEWRPAPDGRTVLYADDAEAGTYIAPPARPAVVRAQSARFVVEYQGFPDEARAAFQYAIDIWQELLDAPIPIRVRATWAPLDAGILGSVGTAGYTYDPATDTAYPVALGQQRIGRDPNPNGYDIIARFNSAGVDWYFGSGQTPTAQYNFATVVLHELGHGLGFADSFDVEGGVGLWDPPPLIFDRFVVNGDGLGLLDTARFPNPSAALAAQLQSNAVFFSGQRARAANGGIPPRLFAPDPFRPGSSLAHFDERIYPPGTPNSLMTPSLSRGETNYDPGPFALAVLADLGWRLTGATPSPSPIPSPPPPPVVTSVGPATPNGLTSATVTWATNVPASSRVFFGTVRVDLDCTLPSCTAGDDDLVTNHSVTLRDLSPNTFFIFQVRSTDALGRRAFAPPGIYQFRTASLEIVGSGKTYDGKFAALVHVPAGVSQLHWSADGQTFNAIDGATTTTPRVVAFAGDLTPSDPDAKRTFTIYVRYNNQDSQLSTAETIEYDPAFKPTFGDVDQDLPSPYAVAISELAGRGIVQGAGGLFRPVAPIARAEAAAVVVRALTWVGEFGATDFSDRGTIDDELWDAVSVLADRNVARGFGDGTFGPTGNVTQGQIISLIARAMVAKGYWQARPDNSSFPGVPAGSGHRQDVITFAHYIPALADYFDDDNWAQTADRRFVAAIVWESVKWREGLVNGAAIYTVP